MSFVQSGENHQTVFPLTNSSFSKEHRQGSGIDEKSSSIESCALLFENPYTDILPSIMTHRKNNDEGLPINAASAPKRSLTDQLVDYVKKTKYFVPCSLLSLSKTIDETSSGKVLRNRPIEHPGKRGSLCLSYAITDDDQTKSSILTLHVIRARQLSLTHPDHHSLNTFVKVTLANDYVQSSKIIHGTNSPIYDEKFSIPLNDKSIATCAKRLTISVYHQSISNNKSDLIGCMSFNMKTLLKTSNKTSMKCKWYCLLPESIGRHKRVAMNVESYSSIHQRKTIQTRRSHLASANSSSNGVLINVEIFNRDDVHFGSGYPCTVSEVKSVFASSSNRPMPGDILLQVNEINVSRTQAKAVNKLIKTLPLPITLQLYRRSVPSSSVKLDKIVLNSVEQHQPLNSGYFCKSSDKNLSFSETYADQAFCSSDKPYSHYEDLTPHLLPETVLLHPSPIDDDQSILLSPIHRKISEISDGSESGVGSESNPYSDGEHRLETASDSYEREALRLIEMEKEFIAQLELGVQFYSRPLKHYLISSAEHGKLFQNIEKILAISRYQLNRLQSLSKATIVNHIGQIFHEKVQLICEAFTRYISGYADACMQLKQLSKCASFQRFIHVNESTLSIEQFLQIPLNHIDNLAHQLDLLCCHCENANDANYLLHVLKELRQCSSCYQESSQSQHHCTTTMTLPSAHGTTTVMSNSIEDEQIIDLQNRLHCSRTGKSLTLTGRNRHVIFSGVLLLQTENKTYIETWAILLNDMLLLTQRNPNDARLALISDPIPLNDIVDFRSSSERQDALIFTSTKPTHPYKIRYPSQCLQCAWQTILEQRLKTWQRSMHDETSSADSDLD